MNETINQIKTELNQLNVTGLVNMTRILVIISKLDELEKGIAELEKEVQKNADAKKDVVKAVTAKAK